MASTTDKLKDLLSSKTAQQRAMDALSMHAQSQKQNGEPLTDAEEDELESLEKERFREMQEKQLRMFAALPEDIREEILKHERAKAIEQAYHDLKNIHSAPSGREETILKKKHGAYYKSYNHYMSSNNLPPYKELLETHADVAAREILLNDKEKDDK